MSISPNTTLAHYTIIAKIGAGGRGEVYRARDSRLDREVAIKLLPAEASRQLAAESRSTEGTNENDHPPITQITQTLRKR